MKKKKKKDRSDQYVCKFVFITVVVIFFFSAIPLKYHHKLYKSTEETSTANRFFSCYMTSAVSIKLSSLH